jgi:gliding motility-associated-like protein
LIPTASKFNDYMKNLPLCLFVGILLLFSSSKGSAQINAAFTADVTSGCEFVIVNFSDQSTGSNLSYLWDYGDGTQLGTAQNPSHPYVSVGVYTVTLTVTNGSGTSTETKTAYIVVHSNPVVDFTLPNTLACLPYSAAFSDATVVVGGAVNSWNWDFGDGTTSTLENPIHTYNSQSSYNVLLIVTDDNGCSASLSKTDFVTTLPSPISLFSQDRDAGCSTPLAVNFTNSSSGSSLNYEWNFGNGNTSTSLTPTAQTYTTLGSFTNSLIVTTSDGCSDTSSQVVVIETFVADFSQDITSACLNEVIDFTDLSTAVANTWSWDFGDGTSSSAQNPSHGYSAPGTYTVELTSFGPVGCTDNVIKSNIITINPDPVVDFTANNTTFCQVPFTVNFTDMTPDAVSWSWTFGDGNNANTETPSNTYTALGNYNVSLSVTDVNGCSASASKSSFITIVPPTVNFNSNKTNGCAPLTVDFSDLTFSNETITNWIWDFGNGNTSPSQNPTETYTDTGSYDVSLVIVNAEGCTDTLIFTDYIQVGQLPLVNFSPKDTVGCHPFTVNFFDSSSVYSDQWSWSFGDGQTSIVQNPINTYIDTGYFDVTYAVGFHGCWDSLNLDSVVEVLLPKAIFTVTPMIGCNAPHVVGFTDASEGADQWTWYFGDGAMASTQNPTHTYTSTGFYTATLIVENFTTSCKDSISQVIRISDRDLGFEQSDSLICETFSVQFTDATIVNSSISSWNWNFGDGGVSTSQNPNYTYSSNGIFDVRLIITDALGCKDTLMKTNTVVVKTAPVAEFVADITFGCAALDVNFTDLSTGINTILGWNWNFGDGGTDNIKDPMYTYNDRGVFNVTLTVTDTFGCVNVMTKNSYIRPTMPYPGFSFTPAICNTDGVLFTNTSTGSDMSYVWNYDDGSPTETDVSPFHTYNINADTSTLMSVMLTVTDSNSCDSTIIQDLTISIPVALFDTDSLVGSCPPHTVNFTSQSSTDVENWTWTFGDNTSASILENPTHNYLNVGSYDVSLTVENDIGCIATLVIPSMITVNGPSGTFTSATVPFTCFKEVAFVSNTINTDSVYFIFGNGDKVYGETVNYIFETSALHSVTMILIDDAGCQPLPVFGTHSVVIENIDANHYIETQECTDLPFVFNNFSSSDSPIISWLWNFGDGETLLNTANVPVEHTFTEGGEITTYLTVTNSSGCTNVTSKVINIPENITVYNVFTPNNDGLNDVFEVETCSVEKYDIQIFDRWGRSVFNSQDRLTHWDGKRNGGGQAESGTYFYRINATTYSGSEFKKKGSISLLN